MQLLEAMSEFWHGHVLPAQQLLEASAVPDRTDVQQAMRLVRHLQPGAQAANHRALKQLHDEVFKQAQTRHVYVSTL